MPRGVKLSMLHVRDMQHFLQSLGIKLDFELYANISNETQFRNLDSGRGVVVAQILGHEKAQEVLNWLTNFAKEYGGKRIVSNKTDEPIDGTQGRGLWQLLADFVELALCQNQEQVDRVVVKINKRLYRGFLNKVDLPPADLRYRFGFNAQSAPTNKTASVPMGCADAPFLALQAVLKNKSE